MHSNRTSKSIKTQCQQRNKEIQVQAKNRTENRDKMMGGSCSSVFIVADA